MNDTVTYPIILTPEGSDYFVQIPDVNGGYTQGNNEADAALMAKAAIGNLLMDVDPKDYPKVTPIDALKVGLEQKVMAVTVDLTKFRELYQVSAK